MYARILAPVDGSETSERGLREAIALARELKSHLLLLHVVVQSPLLADLASSADAERTHERALEFGREVLERGKKHAEEAGVSCEASLRQLSSGRVADAIIQEVARRECQLIVMGTHGQRGLHRLLTGSDAKLVLREAPVPVLLVRHQESQG